jgi:sulfite reductase (NADPH) flavoprotein alpha-component
MLRVLHRWPGLLALVLVTILALSGAALSVFPAVERLAAPQAASDLTVAELASRIQVTYPGVEQIRRAPSGRITAYWFADGAPGAAVIDPVSGRGIGSADPSMVERWLTNLHRSLFMDDAGRLAMAAGAAAMFVLVLTGAGLVARRTGGWRRWFSRLRGPFAGRVHVEVARMAVAGLALSAITALWMTASTFDLLPDKSAVLPVPADVSGSTGVALTGIGLLASTPVTELRELSFPYPGDASDVFTLKTDRGIGYLDQGNGKLLAWNDLTVLEQVSETIYMLHTGQGASGLGLLQGLIALGVPVMGATGVAQWWAARRGRPRFPGNIAAGKAGTIILVGSEGGTTWGFAATLHKALTAAGQRVHTGSMSAFDPARYLSAERIIILAATYGDGDAPSSAKGFLEHLGGLGRAPTFPLAVLGFGDRSFPEFCSFAKAISDVASDKGWLEIVPFCTVDRQSPQDFARWGHELGAVMGIALELCHQPALPASHTLTLLSRRDYGAEVQAATAILRFGLPKDSLWQCLTGNGIRRFEAGDLLGILPKGSTVPRFYSLASANRDGFAEIVVRKHPGGRCSSQLMELQPGNAVSAFLRRNPAFHAGRDRAPLILIGAGTGVGPLAGFVRSNARRRPIHLFFGMRHLDSDFLYGDDLHRWQTEGRLLRLLTAMSRGARPHYVQDALRAEGALVARLICNGARIMVCGGREMAAGVADALADILTPTGLTPATLKAEGRYVEDVY